MHGSVSRSHLSTVSVDSPTTRRSSGAARLAHAHTDSASCLRHAGANIARTSTLDDLRASASAISLSLSLSLSSPTGSSRVRPSQRGGCRSGSIAAEVRLKEAIERARVAERLIRSDTDREDRIDAEASIDRSISSLAETLFSVLADAKESAMTSELHAQLAAALERLVFSEQTRIVTSDGAARLDRLTHYELNLLHARNDDHWRRHVTGLSAREMEMQQQIERLTKENEDLNADIVTFARDRQQMQDHSRELERTIQSLDGRLHIAQTEFESLGVQMAALQSGFSQQQELLLQSRHELASARQSADLNRTVAVHQEATDALQSQVHDAEVALLKMEEEVQTINRLYYGTLKNCHRAIQKKDALATELAEAREQIAQLSQTRDEILRPFTPRPDWRAILRDHPCDLTPTFLVTASLPTADQLHGILSHLPKKDDEIAMHVRTIEQTIDVQNQTKRDLAKAKRDLEIAIRTGLANANSGRAGADSSQRVGMTTYVYTKPKSTSRYFVGLGTGKDVPPYLRCTGKIRNRHLTKKDTELIVREVWAKKMLHDRERGRLDLNLADFLFVFLKNKYGLTSLVAESGYNLADALDRYRWDSDCELFLKILIGEIRYDHTTDTERGPMHSARSLPLTDSLSSSPSSLFCSSLLQRRGVL